MINLLHVQHRTRISDVIEQYVACQEKETRKVFTETRAVLIELEECLQREDIEKFSFNIF